MKKYYVFAGLSGLFLSLLILSVLLLHPLASAAAQPAKSGLSLHDALASGNAQDMNQVLGLVLSVNGTGNDKVVTIARVDSPTGTSPFDPTKVTVHYNSTVTFQTTPQTKIQTFGLPTQPLQLARGQYVEVDLSPDPNHQGTLIATSVVIFPTYTNGKW